MLPRHFLAHWTSRISCGARFGVEATARVRQDNCPEKQPRWPFLTAIWMLDVRNEEPAFKYRRTKCQRIYLNRFLSSGTGNKGHVVAIYLEQISFQFRMKVKLLTVLWRWQWRTVQLVYFRIASRRGAHGLKNWFQVSLYLIWVAQWERSHTANGRSCRRSDYKFKELGAKSAKNFAFKF
jgi:hypothetical protein